MIYATGQERQLKCCFSSNRFLSPISPRHLFQQDHARVTCATMHKPSHLLIVGFNSGVFTLHEMPDFNPIHTLRWASVEELTL